MALTVSISAGNRLALAPGATTIQFSPSSFTIIRATPDGAVSSVKTKSVLIFSFCKPSMVCLPKISLPTFATRVTLPPSLAAATAWLAPLPPAFIKKVPPSNVSPGNGSVAAFTTISVLALPTTTIFFMNYFLESTIIELKYE